MIRLVDVYETMIQAPADITDTHMFLYDLLSERTTEMNISHKGMPSLEEHVRFVNAMPYDYWYLIEVDGPRYAGAIYLTDRREVGIFLRKKYWNKGIGRQAIEKLLELHPGDLLANINPNNHRSILFFEELGAKHIQNTYEICSGD